MKRTYDIIHVKPDKSEHLIANVSHYKDVGYYVELPKYAGTWLTSTRKLLRYGLGEIQIREIIEPMKIEKEETSLVGGRLTCVLTIANGEGLSSISIRADELIGYDNEGNILWKAKSFLKLAELVNKDIAYDCLQVYEKFIKANGLTGIL